MGEPAKEQVNQVVTFGAYRLDLKNGQLWRGKHAVKVMPKAFAALCYFVERPGQLVTKDDLLAAVWPRTVVGEATLASCIQELRQVLHDKAATPRYIETVHGRGYRFLAPLSIPQPVAGSQYSVDSSFSSRPIPNPQSPTPSLVGREPELAQLSKWWAKALAGERQIVFVTGEPGIGKTTLVEVFLQSLESSVQRPGSQGQEENQKAKIEAPTPNTQHPIPGVWVGWGQCIEHYGTGEPYLPVLEALGRLCRAAEGQRLIALLTQHAPTWLVQMPALVSAPELEALHRKTAGVTRERMLRELAEAVEVFAAERPLILWLEDLHWCDHSTLDWLSFLARRRERARLLVIGSYRPIEVIVHEHPLRTVKQDLRVHGQCEELALGLLREEAIVQYLAQRFNVGARRAVPLQSLAKVIHHRTDGNPLFMVNVVDALMSQGLIPSIDGQEIAEQKIEQAAAAIPEDLRQLIEQQLERLKPEERRVLEVASVVGVEFSAAAVAAGLGTEPGQVEEQCTELAHRDLFLRSVGVNEWPDGTVATRYSFQHALYQDVLYQQLSVGRRQRLHQQIGKQEEESHEEQAREIAAELALHFERGRDYRKAVRYLQQASENAVRRSAHQEAIDHLTKGMALLRTLPDSPERAQQELQLQMTLGPVLIATKGYAAPAVAEVYTRMRKLCQQLGKTPHLFPALRGLWGFHFLRGELRAARELGEQILTFAQQTQDPTLLIEAHYALGATLSFWGELTAARTHCEQGIALYNAHHHRSNAFVYGHDPGVSCLCHGAYVLWRLGYPDQAVERSQEALTLAEAVSHPHSLAFALNTMLPRSIYCVAKASWPASGWKP